MKIKLNKRTRLFILSGLALVALLVVYFFPLSSGNSSPSLASLQTHRGQGRSGDGAMPTSYPTQFPQGEAVAQQDETRYQSGILAYKAKHYNQAEKLLTKALVGQPNPNAQFYLGMAYTHEQQYDHAKRTFEMLLAMLTPDHPIAVKTRNNMLYVVKQQMLMAGNTSKANQVLNAALSPSSPPNYLAYILMDGKVIHYDTQHMPLKVYISDGNGIPGWKPELKESMTYAMQTWQTATQNLISFTEVNDPANADIIVRWRTHFSDGLLGLSPMRVVRNTITESDVNLAASYPDSNELIPLEELKGIAVHELGHAIGIQGHSPIAGDLMFPTKTQGLNKPSQRDITTLTMLYRMQSDAQNNTQGSTAQTQKAYYYIGLGAQAEQKHQTNLAISNFRQALLINPNLVDAKYCLGVMLGDMGTRMARAKNWSAAKHNLEESNQLLTQIKDTSDAPKGTTAMLSEVQHNLDAVNHLMTQ